MASGVTLKMKGDWRKQVSVPLRNALDASINVIGRTGEEACRHAIILMARSAGKLARPHRRTTRPILEDEHGKYVENWTQKSREPQKLYKWMFDDSNRQERIPGTWQNARKIGSAGLAQRSWMWGLSRIGGRERSKRISGTHRLLTITSATANGYVKQNMLSYITSAMPKGWELEVQNSTGKKIMHQAKQKLERRWKSAVLRRERATARTIQSFFKAGLS